MATTPDIGKLKRSYLMHYIDASFGGETPKWFLIGRDIEDMSVELNPDTETVKNILDETVVNDNGYEPSIDADTYYANTGDAIYEKIKDIAMNRLTGDDCKTAILEVLVDKLPDEGHIVVRLLSGERDEDVLEQFVITKELV